jgi:hypothetical protein
MLHENPYKTTSLDERALPNEVAVVKNANSLRGSMALLWWTFYLHPVIVLVLLYGCWTITTASLGRPPTFGESPANYVANILAFISGFGCFLFCLATPVLIPIALVWGVVHPFAQRPIGELMIAKRIFCLSTYFLILASVVFVWNSDPFRVVYWFRD